MGVPQNYYSYIFTRGGSPKMITVLHFERGGSLQMITVDYIGGERVWKKPKIDYVILEQPLTLTLPTDINY